MLYYFVSSYVMMYSKPYYFYKNILVSEYAQKVFWEYHYDYIQSFEQDIEDGKVPASYANCNSLSCADDYTEQTDVKPDVWNDNLGMAARQWMHDYYQCEMLGERRGLTIEELVWKYYAYEVHDL